jgi:hypothetical protein
MLPIKEIPTKQVVVEIDHRDIEFWYLRAKDYEVMANRALERVDYLERANEALTKGAISSEEIRKAVMDAMDSTYKAWKNDTK